MSVHVIADTIQEILERAKSAQDTLATVPIEDRRHNMEFGRLLAFCEVLSLMKTDFVGVEDVEKLLNFDIDKRFLAAPGREAG